MFILISHFSSAVDDAATPKTGGESSMIYEVVLEAASPASHIKHLRERSATRARLQKSSESGERRAGGKAAHFKKKEDGGTHCVRVRARKGIWVLW